jgi:hypothetical protein
MSVGSAGNDADVKAVFDSLQVGQEGNHAVLSAILPSGVFRKLGEFPEEMPESGPGMVPAKPGKSR